MIDIAFSELAIVGVAALIFIGPERLPKVARLAGTLLGRAQRYLNDVKSEVQREIELDELRKLQKDVQDATGDIERTISQGVTEAGSSVQSAWDAAMDRDTDSPLLSPPTPDQMAVKAKHFRKKKMAKTSAVPAWYKHRTGHKMQATSASARVARYRPALGRKSSSFFNP
jgi:sec-independent protein translocase protein TatB